jgi:DNA-binding IclR family transcriptional regulator
VIGLANSRCAAADELLRAHQRIMAFGQVTMSRALRPTASSSFSEMDEFEYASQTTGGATVYYVPSTTRAMRVLEFLAQSKAGGSLSEISRSLALPKSSTYAILKALEQESYLRRSTQSGRYYFGPRLVTLSRNIVENLDLRELARPVLNRLMSQTGIIVHLAVLEGNEAVIIDRSEPPGSGAGADWVGRRLDVNCTGVGKALAAFLPAERFEELITAKRFARHNENTIVTLNGLKRELAKVREDGYAFDDEEDEIGVRCIGVPVFDSRQQVIAAISLAGTIDQIPVDCVRRLARALKEASAEISIHLDPLRRRHGRDLQARQTCI